MCRHVHSHTTTAGFLWQQIQVVPFPPPLPVLNLLPSPTLCHTYYSIIMYKSAVILQKENSSKIAVTRADTFNHSYTVLVPSGIVVIRVCTWERTHWTLGWPWVQHVEVMQRSCRYQLVYILYLTLSLSRTPSTNLWRFICINGNNFTFFTYSYMQFFSA